MKPLTFSTEQVSAMLKSLKTLPKRQNLQSKNYWYYLEMKRQLKIRADKYKVASIARKNGFNNVLPCKPSICQDYARYKQTATQNRLIDIVRAKACKRGANDQNHRRA